MCCIPGPGLQAPGSLSPCPELGPRGFLEPYSLGRWEGRVWTCFKTSALSLAKGVGGAGAEGRRRTGGPWGSSHWPARFVFTDDFSQDEVEQNLAFPQRLI